MLSKSVGHDLSFEPTVGVDPPCADPLCRPLCGDAASGGLCPGPTRFGSSRILVPGPHHAAGGCGSDFGLAESRRVAGGPPCWSRTHALGSLPGTCVRADPGARFHLGGGDGGCGRSSVERSPSLRTEPIEKCGGLSLPHLRGGRIRPRYAGKECKPAQIGAAGGLLKRS